MTYIDQYNTSQDSVFQRRVRVAMLTSATNVLAEDPATANHAARAAYANKVLNAPVSYVDIFAEAVCTNAIITVDSVDGDIQFTVNGLWNALAGS